MCAQKLLNFNFVFPLQNKIKVVALKITNNINVLIKVSPFFSLFLQLARVSARGFHVSAKGRCHFLPKICSFEAL
jgi:hypothetical protein